MLRNLMYFAPEGAGGGSGDGKGGDGKGGDAGKMSPEDIAALRKQNEDLNAQVTEMSKKMGSIESLLTDPNFLEALGKKGGGDQGGGGNNQDGKGAVKPDFDNMTNEQLAGHIVTTILGEVKKMVAPIQDATGTVTLKDQVRDAASQFEDFWDYQEAMVKLANAYPKLDATSLYLLAVGLEKATGKPLKKENPDARPRSGGGARPTPAEASSGPAQILGELKGKEPKSYGETAGMVFDKIFGKG